MKVGEYVRTDTGKIAKIKNIIDYGKDNEFEYLNYNDVCVLTTENDYNHDVVGCRGRIIKSSPNIIDLIEENDVIHFEFYGIDNINNVMKENDILNVGYDEDGDIITLKDIEIKSIVTKEQFESMEYKI